MGAQRKLAPVSPHHLIFMIWAATQHYADFAPQVEAVTGATLRDEAFSTKRSKAFSALLLKDSRALTGWRQWAAQITLFTLQQRG